MPDFLTSMNFAPGTGMIRGQSGAAPYQSAIDTAMNKLRQAQLAGAPPSVISGLQQELAMAQRAMQQAGAGQMANYQKEAANRPWASGGNVGGSPGQDPYRQQHGTNDAINMQMLMSMFGLGGGGRGPGY
jgi:hypothetical protein